MKSYTLTGSYAQITDTDTGDIRMVSASATPRQFNAVMKLLLANDVESAFDQAGVVQDERLDVDGIRTTARNSVICEKTKGRFTHRVLENSPDRLFYINSSTGEEMPIHGKFLDIALSIMSSPNADITPLDNFLSKVEANNYTGAGASDLFEFLAVNNHPITTDGDFLAFKIVRSDLTDFHTGTISHAVGSVIGLSPEDVDFDRDQTCSRGLHFCSRDYLPQYGGFFGTRNDCALLILKISPSDVAAFPRDYKNAKGRAVQYQVLAQMPNDRYHFIINNILSCPIIDVENNITDVEFMPASAYRLLNRHEIEADIELEVEERVEDAIAAFNKAGGPTPTIATSRWIVESVNVQTGAATCVANASTRSDARTQRDVLNTEFKTPQVSYRVRDRHAD